MRLRRRTAELVRTFLRRLRQRTPCNGYIGWVGRGNLGDDAMFAAARKLLGPQIELMARAQHERRLYELSLAGPRRFQVIFLGGGTLVNKGYIRLVEECLRQGVPMATLGTGVGAAGFSQENAELDPRWIEALAHFRRVGVRGAVSVSKLRAGGFEGAEIIGDLALALTPDRPVCNWTAKTFILNVAPARSERDKQGLAAVNSSLKRLVRHWTDRGWSAIPVALSPVDIAPLRTLLTEAGVSDSQIRMPRTFESFQSIARTASLSIGIRLHSSVLASACGIPSVLFGYRDKCLDFASSIGIEQQVVNFQAFTEERLFEAFDSIAAQPQVLGADIHDRCLKLRRTIHDYANDVLNGRALLECEPALAAITDDRRDRTGRNTDRAARDRAQT